MPENKRKKDRPPIRVSPEMKVWIESEGTRLRLFEYEVVELMQRAYQASQASTGSSPPLSKEGVAPRDNQALMSSLRKLQEAVAVQSAIMTKMMGMVGDIDTRGTDGAPAGAEKPFAGAGREARQLADSLERPGAGQAKPRTPRKRMGG